MKTRSIGSVVVGVGLFAGVLSACGDDSGSAGGGGTSSVTSAPESSTSVPRSAPVTSSSTTVSDPVPVVDEPTSPGGEENDPIRPPVPTVTRTPAPPVDDGPHDLLGNIAIWTSAEGKPLNGAAFVVDSCGDAADVGLIDMSGQANIDVPVSIGCWVVGLTRTPDGYALSDGPSQKTVHLDAGTNEVILSFRFVATGQAATVEPNGR